MRELSHGRCAKRCCCRSWSCEPHQRTCGHVVSREMFAVGRGGGSFVEETAADLLPRIRPRFVTTRAGVPVEIVERELRRSARRRP